MTTAAFGQDTTFWIFPLVDDTSPQSGFPTSQTPAIYVYRDEPSRSQAAAGTGSPVHVISSWTWDAGRNGWYFTVPAIEDPDPTSSLSTRTYWVAANFLLKTGGQVQTVLRTLDLERVAAHTADLNITDADLEAYLPQVTAYTTDVQRMGFTRQAIEDVKGKLKAKGYQWARIQRPDRLKQVVVFRALAMICLAQIKQRDDDFASRYVEYKELFVEGLDGLTFEYDSDGDGAPDTEERSTGTVFVFR